MRDKAKRSKNNGSGECSTCGKPCAKGKIRCKSCKHLVRGRNIAWMMGDQKGVEELTEKIEERTKS